MTPQPVTSLVTQGTGSIGRFEVIKAIPFSTTGSGRIDVTVDWTFTTNLLQVSLFRGRCTAAELTALNCGNAVTFANLPKPVKVSLTESAGGNYTLAIVNLSFNDESFAYQVTQTR